MNGVTFWASVKVPSAGIEGAIVAGTGNVSPYFAARSGGNVAVTGVQLGQSGANGRGFLVVCATVHEGGCGERVAGELAADGADLAVSQ